MLSSLLGGVGFLLPLLLAVPLVPFLVIYILNKAKPTPDETSVGPKIFFLLLITLCFQLFLFGFSLLFISFLIEDMPDVFTKGSMGLIFGSVVTAVYPILSYVRRIREGSNAVERQAAGINAMITGLVFMVSTISLCVLIFIGFSDESTAEMQEEPIKILLVFSMVNLIGTFVASKFFVEE